MAILIYALRRTGALADAQEVVSETFLIAWRRVGDIPSQEPVLWLYSVAKKVLQNRERSQRRRGRLEAKVGTYQETVEPPADESIERSADLMKAMSGLKASHREALTLSYWQDLEASQAAKVLGCSHDAYNTLLHRARRALASALAKQREEVSER